MEERTRSLYADVLEQGGLCGALQAAFLRIGSSMRVREFDGGRRFSFYALVKSASRQSQVMVAAERRLFSVDFWSRGVNLASGGTPDLDRAALAIDRWVGSSCGTGELVSAFDFVEAVRDAWAYEQGIEVEERWRAYLETIPESIPELQAVVSAAATRPALRQLFPYTSMNRLCFSRCTGYPFTRDIPSVVPAGGDRYRVYGPTGEQLGSGVVEEALDIVIKHLPPGCGPAIAGTDEEIGRLPRRLV
jgi:hypothetical protein